MNILRYINRYHSFPNKTFISIAKLNYSLNCFQRVAPHNHCRIEVFGAIRKLSTKKVCLLSCSMFLLFIYCYYYHVWLCRHNSLSMAHQRRKSQTTSDYWN